MGRSLSHAEVAPPVARAAVRPLRLLLVDDSPTVRLLTRMFLMERKCDWFEAEDGARALAIARVSPLDLIIADVRMPVLGGFEMLQALRAETREELRRLPVILLTSERDEEVVQRATREGAQAILHKPVSGATLLSTIDRVLASMGP